jgi:hypothetical protein
VDVLLGLIEFLGVTWKSALEAGEWLADLKTENSRWYWVVIGVGCWTALVALIGCAVIPGSVYLDLYREGKDLSPPSAEQLMWSMICGSLPALIVFALPAWAVLAFALRSRAHGPTLGTEEAADVPPKP